MKFSDRGIPIFDLTQKCEALEYCLRCGHHEDAEGHIWDLLHLIHTHHVPDDWVEQMRDKFGMPTPITKG